ncbi:hypothetical protein VNO77_03732 [Canavalia gladiata]|uniref:Uncharacterized protein n=1 Tax=Canavalia gladiata TaxID=3824 RepID=A0AAN9MV75_CANGL
MSFPRFKEGTWRLRTTLPAIEATYPIDSSTFVINFKAHFQERREQRSTIAFKQTLLRLPEGQLFSSRKGHAHLCGVLVLREGSSPAGLEGSLLPVSNVETVPLSSVRQLHEMAPRDYWWLTFSMEVSVGHLTGRSELNSSIIYVTNVDPFLLQGERHLDFVSIHFQAVFDYESSTPDDRNYAILNLQIERTNLKSQGAGSLRLQLDPNQSRANEMNSPASSFRDILFFESSSRLFLDEFKFSLEELSPHAPRFRLRIGRGFLQRG